MSISGTQPTAPGWYPDPAGTRGRRWHDGQDWTGQVTLGEPTRLLGHGFAQLGDWLARMLGVCGALLVALVAWPAWYWINPPQISLPPDPASASVAAEQIAGPPGALAWVAVTLGILSLVTVVTWLVWQYLLAASAPVALRRSPAAHVWWWFVPFASYWVPRGNIDDLWHAYGRQQPDEPGEPAPVVFSLWWALVLAPLLFEPVSALLLVSADTLGDAVSVVMGNLAVTLVAAALAAVTARTVVRDLSWRALLYFADAR